VKFFLKLFRLLLKFGLPANLILLPLLAAYGWYSPWPPAVPRLAQYSGQAPLLVGASSQMHYSAKSQYTRSSRSYLLFPSVFSDPKVVTFVKVNAGPVIVDESSSQFWSLLFWVGACSVGTWWFWFRRISPNTKFDTDGQGRQST
jgi:hypothetical protein